MITTAVEFANALTEAFAEISKSDITFAVNHGKKYEKVVVTSHGSPSVYCFIDKDGNIYKAASWAAPAKGVRATLSQMTPDFIADIAATGYACTGWLYRSAIL